MGIEQKTHFKLDKSKCIRCGKCINTCSGMVIAFGKDGLIVGFGYPEIGYARGVQKDRSSKIHRYTDRKK